MRIGRQGTAGTTASPEPVRARRRGWRLGPAGCYIRRMMRAVGRWVSAVAAAQGAGAAALPAAAGSIWLVLA